MTQVDLNPDAATLNEGTNVGGSIPGILTDSSDSTYVELDAGESLRTTFADLSLPAGAEVRFVISVLRLAQVGLTDVIATLETFGAPVAGWGWHGGAGPTNVFGPALGKEMSTDADLTDSQVDIIQFQIQPGGPGLIRLYKLWLVCQYWVKPTVNVTLPTGTTTDDDTPAVGWSRTWDPHSDEDKFFEVKIFTAAQVAAGGFDPDETEPIVTSGVVEADPVVGWIAAYELEESLDDGSYHAYVRVADVPQTEKRWSAWDSNPFTIDIDRPNVPGLTLIPQDAHGRIRIEITDTGGAATADYMQIQRRTGSEDWTNVRTLFANGRANIHSGEATGYDYEAQNGVASEIRVRAAHEYGDTTAYSAWATDTATWSSSSWWLKHPFNTQLNREVTLRSQPSRTSAARQGISQPLGRRDPVVVSDARQLWTGEIAFRSATDEDRAYIEALVLDSTPLLLQAPPGIYWQDLWMVLGALEQGRVIDLGWSAYTFDSLPWVQVARPEGTLETFPDFEPPVETGDDLILL